jgi:membrane protease YdiL (CAAX protease family)
VTSGLAYTSVWGGALVWNADRSRALHDAHEGMNWNQWSDDQKDDYTEHEELPRQAGLSAQYITAVGSMSAWHSFRTSAETQKSIGRYEFLKQEETPMDLLAAPFQFAYLQRKTTWIPMVIAAGLGALSTEYYDEEKYQRDPFSASDAFYASAFSYNAGVSEEALFRGYMQPVLYQAWDSPFWSNAVQALVFGLAHLGSIDRPVAQIGMGYYLGWLQQRRDWTLGEGIFIHAWWDVIALSSSYLVRLKDSERGPPPVIWLPTMALMF